MKTLLILRHAKSGRKNDPAIADHDRPLEPRGERESVKAGRFLRRRNLVPDLILSSTARRAQQTAEKAAKASGYKGEIRLRKGLYPAGAKGYIKYLRKLPKKYDRVVLVGHNPGLERLIEKLTRKQEEFPTGAIAQLELPIKRWKEFSSNKKYPLVLLWRPKEK
jgi:phosphohistidine phosphatase